MRDCRDRAEPRLPARRDTLSGKIEPGQTVSVDKLRNSSFAVLPSKAFKRFADPSIQDIAPERRCGWSPDGCRITSLLPLGVERVDPAFDNRRARRFALSCPPFRSCSGRTRGRGHRRCVWNREFQHSRSRCPVTPNASWSAGIHPFARALSSLSAVLRGTRKDTDTAGAVEMSPISIRGSPAPQIGAHRPLRMFRSITSTCFRRTSSVVGFEKKLASAG